MTDSPSGYKPLFNYRLQVQTLRSGTKLYRIEKASSSTAHPKTWTTVSGYVQSPDRDEAIEYIVMLQEEDKKYWNNQIISTDYDYIS